MNGVVKQTVLTMWVFSFGGVSTFIGRAESGASAGWRSNTWLVVQSVGYEAMERSVRTKWGKTIHRVKTAHQHPAAVFPLAGEGKA